MITLTIHPTTGHEFEVTLCPTTTVEELKKCLAARLRVGREVISLLHRESLLTEGTLESHGLETGSTLRLVPCIETGILTPRPEQSVLEALESLNENQVSDFLSGKSPLNLTMRLGEHVMLIQLQLSKASTSSTATAASTTTPVLPTTTTASSSMPKKTNLTEASRSLTNTLKKLSNTVSGGSSTSSSSSSTSSTSSQTPTAVHKQLHHHGKGVYSGTFSGTLNPTLQDGQGKPRKHVSTIVHILNDLLGNMDLKSNTGNLKRKSTSASDPAPKLSKPLSSEEAINTRQSENDRTRTKLIELKEQLRVKTEERLRRHRFVV